MNHALDLWMLLHEELFWACDRRGHDAGLAMQMLTESEEVAP